MISKISKKAGLTLVEVMLALAILSMGLVGLIASTSRCLAVIHKTKKYEMARSLLNKLDAIKPIDEDKIIVTKEGGSFDRPYEKFHWQRAIEQEGREGDFLYKITVKIIWSEYGKENSETVVSYLYARN